MDNISFLKSNKLCPLTDFKMAKSKKTEKDFAFSLLPAMKHCMSGDEKGKTKVGAQKGKYHKWKLN